MSVGAACVAGAFYYALPLRWIEASFALFCVAFSAGLGPVTYVYMPEVRARALPRFQRSSVAP